MVSPEARLETRDKLHITLQFIGDFDESRSGYLFESTAEVLESEKHRSSSTKITGIHYFPGLRVRRGIWLDAEDGGSLGGIADSIKQATAGFGVLPEERAFVPHITIARLRNLHHGSEFEKRQTFPDLEKFWAEGKFSVEQFFPTSVALFESTLNPGGSRYRILREFQLEQGRRDPSVG